MIESFKIAANLTVTGDATKKMMAFNSIVTKAAVSTEKLLGFTKLLDHSMMSLSMRMRPMTESIKSLNTNMRPMNNSFSNFNRSLGIAEGRMKKFKYQADTTKNTLRSLASAGNQASASMIYPGRAGGSGIGRSVGLGAAGGAFVGGLGLYNPYVMAGAGAAATLVGGFKQNAKYQQHLGQVSAQGFSPSDVDRANKFASSFSMKGISKSELLTAVVDGAMATGNMTSAIKLAPTLAEISFANKQTFGASFSALEENKLVRFAEMRNPDDVGSGLNLAQRMYSASGGRMLPSQLFNFQTMASTAGFKLTDRGFLQLLPVLQEMGGFRPGTGYNTMFNMLATGKGMSTSTARFGEQLGLLDKSKMVYDPNGHRLMNKNGAMKKEYLDLLQSSPTDFVKQIFLPAIAKKGMTSDSDISKAIAMMFSQSSSRFITNIVKNLSKSDRNLALYNRADGPQNAYLKALNIPSGQLRAVTAAFENFETALGELTASPVKAGMDLIASFLQKLANAINFINQNPFSLETALHAKGINKLSSIFKNPFSNINLFGKKESSSNTVPNVHLSIDGNRFASVVSRVITKNMNTQVNMGRTGVDTSSLATPVGLSYSPGSFSQ